MGRSGRIRQAVLGAAAAIALAPGARAGDYEDALAAAARAARAGAPARAARLLDEPARAWAQDYPLRLAHADYLLLAGAGPRAEEEYRAALALAPDAVEPRLGLAWAAQRSGDIALARSRFADALRIAPDSGPAREGLAALGSEHRGWVGVLGGGTAWSGRPGRTWVASGGVDAGAVLADRWILGGTYRALVPPSAVTGSGSGRRGPGAHAQSSGAVSEDASVQHELHASVGWDRGPVALGVVAGGLGDPGAAPGVQSGVAGALTAAWRAPVELTASAAGSAWDDRVSVLQAELRAALHVAGPLWVSAGGRGQLSAGEPFGAGLLRLELRGRWSLSAAAEAGLQRRPYDLEARALYGLADDLRWAARLRAEAPLGRRARLVAGVDQESFRTPAATGTIESAATRGWAGVVLTLGGAP